MKGLLCVWCTFLLWYVHLHQVLGRGHFVQTPSIGSETKSHAAVTYLYSTEDNIFLYVNFVPILRGLFVVDKKRIFFVFLYLAINMYLLQKSSSLFSH